MAKAKTARSKQPSAPGEAGKIQARVSDFAHGLRVFDGVRLVRVKSSDHTLLIMEDYFPLLGKVRGRVELVTNQDQIDLGEVRGFYLHRNNVFSLLIEVQGDAGEGAAHDGD